MDASILFVGTCPEPNEQLAFTQNAGYKLATALSSASIDPESIRCEYLFDAPIYSIEDHFYDAKRQSPKPSLLAAFASLEKKLSVLSPKVTIALGAGPYWALTGRSDIAKEFAYVIPSKHGTVIPSHPLDYYASAEFAHESHWLSLVLAKALGVVSGMQDITHTLHTAPKTPEIVLKFIERCKTVPIISIDIETSQTYEINCIGIALSENEAMSIPLKVGTASYWKPHEEIQLLTALSALLDSPQSKLFQNFIFDCMHLARFGLPITGPIYDTLWNAHLLNAELPKSLRDLARVHCYCTPWKDGSWKSQIPAELWRYNARDCCRTLEIFNKQEIELAGRSYSDITLKEFRDKHTTPMLTCILQTCLYGMTVDRARLNSLSSSLNAALGPLKSNLIKQAQDYMPRVLERRTNLDELIPEPDPSMLGKSGSVKREFASQLHRKKGLYYTKVYQYPEFNPNSSKQKIHVLEQMGFTIPKMRNNKGIFTSSSSLTSLLKLQLKTPAAFLADLINYATLNKLKTNYSEDALKLDEDGRFRFSYGVTETGRLKCSSTPWDTGRNSQNFPREKQFNFKSAFVADPGHILINTDLSAAEARVLAYITQDPALVRIFSDNLDYHQYVADQLSEMRGQLYTRQLAKRINHASAYGMGGYKFAEIALIEEGITITPEEAQILLDSRNVIFKGVEQWRVGIRKTLTDPDPTNWYLVNPYGRVRYFFGPRNRKENGDWSGQTQKIFRDAYAHEPQSTSSDYLKLAWCDFAERAPWAQVLQECHDSLLIQCRKEDETRTIDALNISMKQDLIVAGKCYHIPHDLKVGYSWGDF